MNAVASPRSRSDWERLVAPLRPEGRALINGKLAAAHSGQVFEKKSPIDGRVIAQVARCGSEDVEAAVAAARASFEAGHWRHAEPRERKRVLLRFAELIRADLERLAMLETLDVGKPIQNSLDVDVPKAIECIAYYGEYADKLYDEIAPTGPNDLALIRREPLGVIAAIVPWNYPLIVTSWKLGPALLVGNSVVLKPAEQSPLSAIRLGELALEAGVPPGVLNVVPGFGEETGKPLALHPDVDMVSFTGSTEVGKLMLRYAGESNLKRVSLECGGKSPHVVLADADLDVAAEAIAWGIYYNAGETCNAGSRLIVHERVREPLLEAIRRVAAGITLGNPFDPATQMGALIDEGHMRRVLGYIDGGVADGARLALGGKRALAETGGYSV
jgi:acyl-CoA reductase-like NAD-dependent aldehyde dehydrogenase